MIEMPLRRLLAAAMLLPTLGTGSALAAAERGRDVVVLCSGFGCHFRTPIVFDGGRLATMRRRLAAAGGSAAAERAAVAALIGSFELWAAPVAGTAADRARSDPTQSGDRAQRDCIDESTTTTALLHLLARHRMLRHHTVGAPSSRGYLIDGRWPHTTAVLVETATGRAWAIDSWVFANGKPAEVMDLERWHASR